MKFRRIALGLLLICLLALAWYAYNLGRLSDRRVVQFWDHDHLIAQPLRESLPQEGEKDINPDPLAAPILWDVVGIYAPGKTWTDNLPTPRSFDGPVNDVVSRVKEILEQTQVSGSV